MSGVNQAALPPDTIPVVWVFGWSPEPVPLLGPRTVVFFALLPQPLPLPEASAIRVPMPPPSWSATEPGPAVVDFDTTVEVRFWQPEAISGVDHRALEVLDGVMRRVVPDALLPPRGQIEAVAETPDPEAVDTYQSVVELRAELPTLNEQAILETFERCVEALQQVDRATRVLTRSQIAPLTRERMHQLVPFATAHGNGTWDRRTGWVIAHRRLPYEVAPEQLEFPSVELVGVQMDRLRRGDPMSLYWDRLLPAYAAYDDGDFDTATLNSAIATETLIDSVIALAYWEDGRTPADAAAALALGIVRKVRTELPRTLGAAPSDWSPDDERGVVGRWRADLVDLRNAIVHRGYVATRANAFAAVEAAENLWDVLTDSVLANTQSRPKGALMLLGHQGIRRGGQWSARVQLVGHLEWIDVFNGWRDEVDAARESRGRPRNSRTPS